METNEAQIPTERQIDLMRHCIGLNQDPPEKRNYFVAGPGAGDDWDDCLALVELRMMEQRDYPLAEGDSMFLCTPAGIRAATTKGNNHG